MKRDIAREIPPGVRAVFAALFAAGHRGYLVGGCLRDILRGVTPHDFDLTTDATPEEMTRAFADFRVIPTGIKHGTLTVLSAGEPVEVTTHRADGDYLDARHPESVFFTRRIEEDLSRRDFTVNAMAWNEETGLIDLFSGEEDLASGVLRAVGDPDARFREDALRILRLFRFSAQLDFAIDENTAAAAGRCRAGLAFISVERIFSELTRLLAAPAAKRGLAALFAAGCAPYVFFDMPTDGVSFEGLEDLPPDAALRLAYLFPHAGEGELRALCRRWHAPNAFSDALVGYVLAAREPLPASPYEARRFTVRYFKAHEGALVLHRARGEDVAAAAELCRKVLRDKTAVELRRLAVNGKELQEAIGLPPEKTAAMLARLQDLVWHEPKENKKASLLAAAERIWKEREIK